MGSNKLYYLYLGVLAGSWIMTTGGFKRRPPGLQIFSILIGLTFFTECLAVFMAIRYHNNMIVYNIYSVCQMILVLLYFNTIIPYLRRTHAGYYLMLLSVAACALNTLCFQPIDQLNSYFLFFEGLLTISLCLLYFLHLIVSGARDPFRNPYFWINLILVFFWSVTFLSWGIYDYLNEAYPQDVWKMNLALLLINYISYAGIGIVYQCRRINNVTYGRAIPV